MPTRLAGSNHVNLTVADLETSTAWYCRVLNLVVVSDQTNIGPPYFTDVAYHGLFDPTTWSYVVGLIQHPAAIPGPFDERRAGLDHVGFAVPTRSDLDDWARHLDAQGVMHSGVVSAPYAQAINFRDPDNIALELSVINGDFWLSLVEKVLPPPT